MARWRSGAEPLLDEGEQVLDAKRLLTLRGPLLDAAARRGLLAGTIGHRPAWIEPAAGSHAVVIARTAGSYVFCDCTELTVKEVLAVVPMRSIERVAVDPLTRGISLVGLRFADGGAVELAFGGADVDLVRRLFAPVAHPEAFG